LELDREAGFRLVLLVLLRPLLLGRALARELLPLLRLAVAFFFPPVLLPPARDAVERLAVLRRAVDFLAVDRLAVDRLLVDFLAAFFFAAICPPFGCTIEGSRLRSSADGCYVRL
jgi:hypothetical protein